MDKWAELGPGLAGEDAYESELQTYATNCQRWEHC